MHNSVLSKRNYAAHTRIVFFAGLIAEHLKINPDKVAALTPKGKDKDVRQMHQREAVADLLDDIALSLGIAPAGEGSIEQQDQVSAEDDAPASGDDQNPGDQEPAEGKETEPASGDDLPAPVVDEE